MTDLMGRTLTDDQRSLVELIRMFVDRECADDLQRHHDEEGLFPHDHWRRMAELDLMGICVPEEHGGTGGTVTDQAVVIEELGRGWFALAEAYATSTFGGVKAIDWHGSEDQKREFLPRFARGELRFAFGVTEPDGGTDVLGALKTRADRDGDTYVINGSKMYTTMADVSDYIVLLARTDRHAERKSSGLTLLLVPTDAPGLTITRVPTLGLRSTPTNQTFFEDVRVPVSARIGEEGNGWRHLVSSLNNERIAVAALAIGNAQAAFEFAAEYATQRAAFGRTIGSFQTIQHYLADMQTALTTSRLLLYHAAQLQTEAKPCDVEATMAKLQASETGVRVTDLGMRIMAGAGYTMEMPMQRFFHDARVFTFGPITNEMARNYLAERMGFPRSF